LKDIVDVLLVFHENVDEEPQVEAGGAEASPSQKLILEGLITFLESLGS